MNIGTAKITKKEMRGVPHHLLDVASPKRKFTVVRYRKKALTAIQKILRKKKIPFLVGGTGFYIRALVDGIVIPEVSPDWKLRKRLEKQGAAKLFKMFKKLDPARAKTIEQKNKRRLIRALEIVIKTKKPVPPLKKIPPAFEVLTLGIKKGPAELKRAIRIRLQKRLRRGMVSEVRKLKKAGVSWKRLEEFGLEYRWIARYLQGKIRYQDLIFGIQKDSEQYARRQMTWFKKNQGIRWIKNEAQAKKLIKNYIK